MGHTLVTIVLASWGVLAEMAPYLLFGFLMAGLLSVLIPPRQVERHLGGRGVWPVVKASAFGVPLPLCSCGVIPVAASLRKHGANRGATTAFLLSTPQTGVDSILVTFSLLGVVFAVFRPIAALVMGIVGGLLVEWFDPARAGKVDEPEPCEDECCAPGEKRNWLVRAFSYGFVALPRDIGKALLLGLVIAGLISALVPKDYFAQYLRPGFLQMVVMMLVGIPVYVCATASVPIAAALIATGISPGAALCFLVAGPATNAATVTTIWKIMGRRTALIYLGTVAGGALASGLALDLIYTHAGPVAAPHHVHEMAPGLFGIASAVVLLGVLAFALVPWPRRRAREAAEAAAEKVLLSITGMTCDHCAQSVARALREGRGVADVQVDLKGGWAVVGGAGLDPALLAAAVNDLGYKATVVEGPGVTAPRLETITLAVQGMTCSHCVESVTRALEGVPGVAAAEVDLKGGRAVITGQGLDADALCLAVSQAGYSASVAGGL